MNAKTVVTLIAVALALHGAGVGLAAFSRGLGGDSAYALFYAAVIVVIGVGLAFRKELARRLSLAALVAMAIWKSAAFVALIRAVPPARIGEATEICVHLAVVALVGVLLASDYVKAVIVAPKA